MTICSLPVRPSGRRLAGDAPAALSSLPLRPGRGRKLNFCGRREGTEGGREDLGFRPVLRPAVSAQCECGAGGGVRGEGGAAAVQSDSISPGVRRFGRRA